MRYSLNMHSPSNSEATKIPLILENSGNDWHCMNGIWFNTKDKSEEISFPLESYSSDAIVESYWSRSRANLILEICKRHQIKILLEIGAGNGLVSIPLSNQGIEVTALEPVIDGAKVLAANGIEVVCGTLNSIKSSEHKVSAIGIFDVLEHIENPKLFLESIGEFLENGGLLLISVPAHNWLYSDFDQTIGHYKRYNKKILRDEMESSGFKEVELRHAFATLVVPAFLLRRLPYLLGRRRQYGGENGVESQTLRLTNVSRIVDIFLGWILGLESKIYFPFGLSIIAVYKKDKVIDS